MTFQFNEGWSYQPEAIAASEESMSKGGLLIAAAGSLFRGAWQSAVSRGITSFLACTVEANPEPAYCQSTGVCTSMIYRALQDCLNWDRVHYGGLSRVVKLCFETLFGGSRVAIGRGQLGSGDGSVGAWIAEYVARIGVLERGMYQGTDLSRPNENLAQYWGRPGIGVPVQLENLSKSHRFAAHRCTSTDELADALASGCFGGICRSRYTHSIDTDGFATFGNSGGHHTCLRGCFIDYRNRRVFVEQQTHGPGVPDPHPLARTQSGNVSLSDGAYLVREEDIARFLAAGEVWVFQPREGEEFR